MISIFKKLTLLLATVACAKAQQLAPVYTECTQPGKVALTFDDGPNPLVTPTILDILKANNIKATFFVNGINYGDLENNQASKDMLIRAYEEGHIIGSHTFYHKDCFLALDDGSLEENIVKLKQTVKSIIGHEPVFFRPPNGSGGFTKEYCTRGGIPYDPRTEQVRAFLGEHQMKIIMWNADTQDWKYRQDFQGSLSEFDKTFKSPGNSPSTSSFISILHDVHQTTAEFILPKLIEHIKAEGYEFVSMSECIGEAPYTDGEANLPYQEDSNSTTIIDNSPNNNITQVSTPNNLNANNTLLLDAEPNFAEKSLTTSFMVILAFVFVALVLGN